VPLDAFTHALVLAQARRSDEDLVPPTALQSLSGCIHRYVGAAASFTAALSTTPHASLNAIHSAGGSGGGGGGGGAGVASQQRWGSHPCPACQQPIPNISGFCIPCATAIPGAWTCGGCTRIRHPSHSACFSCQAPRTSTTPTAAHIATCIAQIQQARAQAASQRL